MFSGVCLRWFILPNVKLSGSRAHAGEISWSEFEQFMQRPIETAEAKRSQNLSALLTMESLVKAQVCKLPARLFVECESCLCVALLCSGLSCRALWLRLVLLCACPIGRTGLRSLHRDKRPWKMLRQYAACKVGCLW